MLFEFAAVEITGRAGDDPRDQNTATFKVIVTDTDNVEKSVDIQIHRK